MLLHLSIPPSPLLGSHLSPPLGGALRAVLKLVKPRLVQSIVSHPAAGVWIQGPWGGREGRREKAKAHDSCRFPEQKPSVNLAHLSISVAHLMTPAATLSQPLPTSDVLIFQGWGISAIFRMTVEQLSFSREEGNAKSSR